MSAVLPLLAHYARKQSCALEIPASMGDKPCTLDRYLDRLSLITLREDQPPRVRYPMHTARQVYYCLRLEGGPCDYPTPECMGRIHDELAAAFARHAVGALPIACQHHWRADQWVDRELYRFDNVLSEHHAQEHRLQQQKFQRTRGEMLLVFPVSVEKMDELARAMDHIAGLRRDIAAPPVGAAR